MKIEFATNKDLQQLSLIDKHIAKDELSNSISVKHVFVAKENNKICGLLRFNLFWDSIPFMNIIYVVEEYRNKHLGKELVKSWETEMKIKGYKKLMTSTLSNEEAQHFYRKLGYKDCGSLLLPNEPLEILFLKEI